MARKKNKKKPIYDDVEIVELIPIYVKYLRKLGYIDDYITECVAIYVASLKGVNYD